MIDLVYVQIVNSVNYYVWELRLLCNQSFACSSMSSLYPKLVQYHICFFFHWFIVNRSISVWELEISSFLLHHARTEVKYMYSVQCTTVCRCLMSLYITSLFRPPHDFCMKKNIYPRQLISLKLSDIAMYGSTYAYCSPVAQPWQNWFPDNWGR
jgi:hypothetical protein